jgi:A/G-specific adenine glycosylase
MPKTIEALQDLADWFEKQKRVFPWREDPSIYKVWISEIMLQQTQAATVIPYFDRFIKHFPSVNELATAPLDEVLFFWAGLGYYQRARNMHRAARLIVEKGSFPATKEEWLSMPGVGEYTAGAILSIALNHVIPILDANVKRVLVRLRRYKTIDKKILWKWSEFFVKTAAQNKIPPRVLNQALMELGALLCLPKKPLCGSCPFATLCKAKKAGDMEKFPFQEKKKWVSVSEKVFGILDSSNKILMAKNTDSKGWRQGLWDFPKEKPSFLKETELKTMGMIHSHYIVTNHKVSRSILFYQIKDNKKRINLPADFQFILLENLKSLSIPIGSPTRKTLFQITSLGAVN